MRPGIHIRAGENVCIQATTPMQSGAAVASRQTARIASSVVTTGLDTIRTGMMSSSSSARAISVGVVGHRAERVVPVQRLAAGDEPDLSVGQGLHPRPLATHRAFTGPAIERMHSIRVRWPVASTGAPSSRGH